MFDFPRWRQFLETKSKSLSAEGLEVQFIATPDDVSKPAMSLNVIDNGRVYGAFENWITGETDYTVAHFKEAPEMRAYKWGVVVTNETFEPTFNEFMTAFRHHARTSELPASVPRQSSWWSKLWGVT